jgi:putative NADH-flavin reductase
VRSNSANVIKHQNIKNMKILLIGATGNIGQRILKEILSKGYEVTAAQRHPEKLRAQHPHLTVIKADLLDETELPSLLSGYDLIISAISAAGAPTPEQFKKANDNLIAALQGKPDQRLIIVGGAGNTEVAPGVRVVHSPIMDSLPEEWKPDIFAHAYVLDQYKASEVNWTYFSPARDVEPGERTGKYRVGTGNMIIDDNGNSQISMEDYAAALVDEIEDQRFVKQQMSIGY